MYYDPKCINGNSYTLLKPIKVQIYKTEISTIVQPGISNVCIEMTIIVVIINELYGIQGESKSERI